MMSNLRVLLKLLYIMVEIKDFILLLDRTIQVVYRIRQLRVVITVILVGRGREAVMEEVEKSQVCSEKTV